MSKTRLSSFLFRDNPHLIINFNHHLHLLQVLIAHPFAPETGAPGSGGSSRPVRPVSGGARTSAETRLLVFGTPAFTGKAARKNCAERSEENI